MQAADAEMSQLADRWRLLPGDDRSASLLLEDLLESQQRLNDAEFTFLQAQLNYSLSQMTVKQAMGTLLEQEQIAVQRGCGPDAPALLPGKIAVDRQPSGSGRSACAAAADHIGTCVTHRCNATQRETTHRESTFRHHRRARLWND